MAQIRLEPPATFNFRTPDEWPRWRNRFEQFRFASGLSDDDPKKQVNTLLYCIGEEAESVLSSMNVTLDERRDYDAVLKKFDAFFKVRRNVIFERARFNCRNQHEGEKHATDFASFTRFPSDYPHHYLHCYHFGVWSMFVSD